MSVQPIELSERKQAHCPFCGSKMSYKGDGRYVCTQGCGEFLKAESSDDIQEVPGREKHQSTPWPELAEGMPDRLRQGMIDIATLPLQTVGMAPCLGHGGKGGGKGGRAKSPARQKAEAWVRRTAPGRIVRAIRAQ
jgi:hypothetical protein